MSDDDRTASEARLESWKEIAEYLRREVRTVQRWEQEQNLPVHRHSHHKRSSVYAFPAELDDWRRARAPEPANRQSLPLWGIGLTLALALVTSGSHSSPRTLSFQERDWVLLDGFENRTGEALFDGTLRAALERELSNSEFINIAPRDRVEDALRLMRKPPDGALTAAQAREVCLRDGAIRALVTGRTEKLGSTYLVSAEVIDPAQNLTLAADTETASGQDQVWPAVRRLSNWVRETLGETMERIDRSNRQMEKVTTPSLRALQLFTEADSASRRGQWAISAQLTRQALVEDPGFASARMWLAYALHNLRDPEWKAEAQKAFDLSGTVSERERYFIQGGYELLMDHPDRALPAFEALVRRYPDHYFAFLNLVNIYTKQGRREEAAQIAARLADARPNDPKANAFATSAFETIDLARARHYAQRANELGFSDSSRSDRINVIYFHAHDLWMRDDPKGVLAELQHLSAQAKETDPILGRSILFTIAYFHLTLGKFQSAQQLFASIERPHPSWSPTVSFFQGDEGQARRGAELIPENPGGGYQGMSGFLVARLWPPGAEAKLSAEQDPFIRGEVALTQGRFAEATAMLQHAFDDAVGKHLPMAHWIADGLVTALEHSGNSQKALDVLEKTSQTRMWISPLANGYAAFWMRDQARLSAYYHRLGRQAEARKVDDQLRKLLAFADPDHPILRQLNGR